MTPDEMWSDPNYRERISYYAGRITQRTATLHEIEAYRAHVTLFRLMGAISEEMAMPALSSAAKAEAAITAGNSPDHALSMDAWMRR